MSKDVQLTLCPMFMAILGPDLEDGDARRCQSGAKGRTIRGARTAMAVLSARPVPNQGEEAGVSATRLCVLQTETLRHLRCRLRFTRQSRRYDGHVYTIHATCMLVLTQVRLRRLQRLLQDHGYATELYTCPRHNRGLRYAETGRKGVDESRVHGLSCRGVMSVSLGVGHTSSAADGSHLTQHSLKLNLTKAFPQA